ncbi:MAG: hypothetical protein IKR19_08165 [Acholeplasmatales bacterium]|nr:hypothetical protein [Acholeplasmatales bacterium]
MGVLYEALSNVPANNDVIPESCLSFYEQAMYIVDFAMNESAEFKKSIGEKELATYRESGELVSYVGEDAEVLEEAFKDKATKMFGAMKASFSKLNTYFVSATKNGAKLVNSIIPEMIEACPDTLGKTHTFFDFSKIKFAQNAIKVGKKIDVAFKNKKNISKDEALKIDQEISKDVFKQIIGIDAESIKDMKVKLKAELTGSEIEVNKAWVKKNFNKMKELVGGSKIPGEVKIFYNEQKKLIDGIFDTCYSHDGEKEYNNAFMGWEDALSNVALISFIAYNISFDVYKRMYREYFNILYKVSKAKTVKESVVPDSEIEDKNLVDQADPKEKVVPDSVVDEGAVSKELQKAGKAMSKTAPAKAGMAVGKAIRNKIDEKKVKDEAIKECDDVNDQAAREGEVTDKPAEEFEGKPVSEAPDVSTVEEGTFTRQHTLINSLFDF